MTASEGVANCTLPSSKGDDDKLTASEHTTYLVKDFERDINPLGLLQGFTTSFADGDLEKLNTQIHFNTDSVVLFVTTQLQCLLSST
jgi:hypothetical protein